MLSYRMKIARVWREFDLRPISELPSAVINAATEESLVWDVFAWGMIAPGQLIILDGAPMRLLMQLYKSWQADSEITVEQIRQLMVLIDKHSAALEADLINHGMRLRDFPSGRFNWRDLWVFVTYLGVHSNTFAVTNPTRAGWDRTAYLLADVVDATTWLAWAKSKAAAEGSSPPDPVARPGIKRPEVRKGSRVTPSPRSRIRELAHLDETPSADRQVRLDNVFR